MDEREKLLQAIALQETLRGVVDDAVIDTAIAVLRERAASLGATKEERQRKQITVFFADLVDFTGLVADLDPEEVGAIQTAYFQCCRRFIEQYGGRVEKYIGDAVMAVFGIPNRHEQDPENGVRAALGIQEAIADLNQRLPLEKPLRVRIGINTGEVVVSYRSEWDFSVVGDVVNVAKRLEEAAPAGGVLVDYNTYSHIRYNYPMEPQPPLIIKGKSSPVQCYLVVTAGEQRLPETNYKTAVGTVPMIGREQELERLQAYMAQVRDSGEFLTVFVTGDGGLGKSRLLEEFILWLRHDETHKKTLRFHVRTDWQSRYIPYTLLYKLFAAYFDFQESDSREALRRKLVDGFMILMGPNGEEKAHFLGQLIGLDFSGGQYVGNIKGDAEQIFGRSMHYLRQFLTQTALQQPLLIMMEDIHWADTGSLNMIAQIVKRCRHLPILLICTTRPQFLEQEESWMQQLAPYELLELQPLSSKESEQFSKALLQRVTNLPELLVEKIVENSGGNPYYVEELVWMLIEDGIIYLDGEQWWVNEEILEELRIPPTLTGVLQARLDRLSVEERQVLQRAAAIGRNFWEATVEYLLVEREPLLAKSKQILARLSRRKLIRPLYTNGNGVKQGQGFHPPQAPTQQAPTQQEKDGPNERWQIYSFQYPLLQEVTYNSILKTDRRLYHRRIADWYLAHYEGEKVENYAPIIALHYDRAGDIDQAASWYGRAAEFTKQAYAYEESLAYYERALDLKPGETADPERIPLLDGLGLMLVAQIRYEDALRAFQSMLAEAEITGDRMAQSSALVRLAYVYFNMGNHKAAISSATRAEQMVRALVPAQPAILTRALSRKCSAFLYLGHIQEALKAGYEALEIARRINDEPLIAINLGEIYLCYKALGRHNEAKEYIGKCLQMEEERGDLAAAARSTNSLGELARLQGDYEKAAAYYHRAYLTLEEIGDITYKMIVLSNLGGVMVATGNYAAALIPLSEAIATVGPRWLALPETYRFLAEAYLGLGKGEEALAAIQESVELGRIQDNPEFTGHAWRVLGKVSAYLNRPVSADSQDNEATYSAADCFQKSVAIFQKADMERDRAFAYWDWGDYAMSQNEPELAHEHWQAAREIFIELDFPLLVEKLDAVIFS